MQREYKVVEVLWVPFLLAVLVAMPFTCMYLDGQFDKPKMGHVKLRCGSCGRVVYDGPGEYSRNCPVPWPTGELDYCKPEECKERQKQKEILEMKEWSQR